MKKIIKNILIVFLICFAILNIGGLIFNKIGYYFVFREEVLPILNGEISNEMIEADRNLYNSYKEQYGENALSTTLAYFQGYVLGNNRVIEMQQTVLIISISIGISLGTIISLTEKSKIKEILIFIELGLGLALINTTYIHLTKGLSEYFLITMIEECIIPYGIYYVLIYLVIYIIKFLVGKGNAKKLNNELIKNKK